MTTLFTKRLSLEPMNHSHLDGLHAMNAMPEVMRYIGGTPQTREQTVESIERVQRAWSTLGTSWWTFVDLVTQRVMGAGCIQYARREAEPASELDSLRRNPLEIGWRLRPDFWHLGYASEAARRMAQFAFEDLQAQQLMAVRHPENFASARVMERLGMRYRGVELWYGMLLPTHTMSRAEWFGVGTSPIA